MNIVLALFRYFPYGGLSKDMLRIANALNLRGHKITICTESWYGEKPSNSLNIRIFKSSSLTNHGRAMDFISRLSSYFKNERPDLVIGFNKMPYLDIYFAADLCYMSVVDDKYCGIRRFLYNHSRRYKTYSLLESMVFSIKSKTRILFLDKTQVIDYRKWYEIPESKYIVLPPGVHKENKPRFYNREQKLACREKIGARITDFLFIQIGSDFYRKGLDRSIQAIASLPYDIRSKTKLVVVGKDNKEKFEQQIKKLSIGKNIIFLDDVQDASLLIATSDVLIHPARYENTGTAIVEALATGIPVIATTSCGFSHYVTEYQSGYVIEEPFEQQKLNARCLSIMDKKEYEKFHSNSMQFNLHFNESSFIDRVCEFVENEF